MATGQLDERAYDSLFSEVVSLKHIWSDFEFLFCESRKRVEMLAFCAQQFFEVHRRVLLREIFLSISRLSDPPTSRVQDNVPQRRLILDSRTSAAPAVLAELTHLIGEFEAIAKPFRRHRHKYIAHKDNEVTLAVDETAVLGQLRKSEVTKAVGLAESAVQCFKKSVLGRGDANLTLTTLLSARKLIEVLETSDRVRKRRGITA